MSKTTFATNNALTKQVWEEKLFRDVVKETYFSKFSGKDSTSIVHVKENLTKSKGDTINFGIRMRLAGAGVTSGQTLEGNEESLTTHDYSIALERYRHAVRDNGALDRQRAMFSIDNESKAAIKEWGTEKLDELAFDALLTSPTAQFYLDSSGVPQYETTAATAKAALDATNSKLSPKLLSYAKTWALTGGNRSQPPLRPVRVKGKKYFVALIHPDVAYDVRRDSEWMQAMREAMPRGESNPIFAGALGVWDGVVLHEHENVTIATDGGGASVAWAHCALMGAQALCQAWGERPSVVQKNFDYEEEHGYAIRMTTRYGKPVFNSLDFGSVALYVARTQISDAS